MALAGSGSVNMTLDAPLVGIAAKNFFAQWPDITDRRHLHDQRRRFSSI